ncbi:hypothetical protein M758_10G035800 [Ceratodon purpureus]|nr:hypothetical protein M758_10G035800 [Ceratodon purpureus]
MMDLCLWSTLLEDLVQLVFARLPLAKILDLCAHSAWSSTPSWISVKFSLRDIQSSLDFWRCKSTGFQNAFQEVVARTSEEFNEVIWAPRIWRYFYAKISYYRRLYLFNQILNANVVQ